MPPKTMKAIKTPTLGHCSLVTDAPIPTLTPDRAGYVLVKVTHIALNPADYLFRDSEIIFHPNATIGCDYAGIVEEVGADMTKGFRKGDRIAGFCYPGNWLVPEGGCAAEWAILRGDVQFKVEDMTPAGEWGKGFGMVEASSLGVAVGTVGWGLFSGGMRLGFPGLEWKGLRSEENEGKVICIYGGSTTTGMVAVQAAKLAGLKVVATASKKNFGMLRDLGADVVVDYHDPDACVKKINEEIGDEGLDLVFDCIGAFDAPKICAEILSKRGEPIYNAIVPPQLPRNDVNQVFTRGNRGLGEKSYFAGNVVDADLEAFEFAKKWTVVAEGLIREGKIRSPPVETFEGMEKIPDQLDRLRKWEVSGKKLVCVLGGE